MAIEKRQFGRTGHRSSAVIFGGAALSRVTDQGVADQVLDRGEDGRAAWPGTVEHWVNVESVGDHACAQPRLAEVFGPRVVDRLVDNGHRAHDPQPYLNNPATGAAVAEALARVRGEPL